jgi:hypothetical protein
MTDDLPKLLRAIARSTQAQETKHDVVFNAAADLIDDLRATIAEQDQEIGTLNRQNIELRGAVSTLLQHSSRQNLDKADHDGT